MVSVTNVSFPGVSSAAPGDVVTVRVTVETGTNQALKCTMTISDNFAVLLNGPVWPVGPTANIDFEFEVPQVDEWNVCAGIRDCKPVSGFKPQRPAVGRSI